MLLFHFLSVCYDEIEQPFTSSFFHISFFFLFCSFCSLSASLFYVNIFLFVSTFFLLGVYTEESSANRPDAAIQLFLRGNNVDWV